MRGTKNLPLVELMVVVSFILILGAITVGHVNRNNVLGHETAAIRMIQTIHTAQAQYHAQSGMFAQDLSDLGFSGEGRDGYVFAVHGSGQGYTISAVPVSYKRTGRRTFVSDETLVLRENWGPNLPAIQSSQVRPGF